MDKTDNLKWGLCILLLGIVILGVGSCNKPEAPVREVGAPTQVIPLEPYDRAMDIPITQLLTWMPAKRATAYDIYFGTSDPPPYRTNTSSTSCDPGTLDYQTTYYWRIDSKNDSGTNQGDTRIFTTRSRGR